ncbi:ent-kaurenoic acid oxidase 1-like [Silene latifolia]|uniref:ent-kaurenoic acid oxidase 1-like n=1 Tax=Silene latifolia TaxID=37657 RepID=UPI003D77BC7A
MECHHFHKTGDWRRTCPVYHEDLKAGRVKPVDFVDQPLSAAALVEQQVEENPAQAATTGFKQGWPSSEVLGPHSVITIHGLRHQHIKSLLASEFNHRNALTRVALQFQPCIVAALQSWFQMGKINAFYQVKKVALEFMGRYMSGLELGPDIDALDKLFSAVNEGVRAQPWNFPGTPFRHALQCRKKLTEKLTLQLAKKKKEGKEIGEESDMMDRLMQSKDKEGKHLSNEEVVDNVLSNIAISYIGIAYLVTWAMYFLAKNPHVLQKIREENMEMAREKNGAEVTYEDLLKLKYTNKVRNIRAIPTTVSVILNGGSKLQCVCLDIMIL